MAPMYSVIEVNNFYTLAYDISDEMPHLQILYPNGVVMSIWVFHDSVDQRVGHAIETTRHIYPTAVLEAMATLWRAVRITSAPVPIIHAPYNNNFKN
jgi:hypothetical protein